MAQKDRTQQHRIKPCGQNVAHHGPGENGFVAALGRFLHIPFQGRLPGEGQTAQGVHYQVDPEHLGNGHRRVDADKGSQKGDAHGAEVHGQLESEEFPNALENGPAIADGLGDGSEIVIQNDDITGFPRHLRAAAHGKAHVGQLQGGGVVDAVASHTGHQPQVLSCPDETALVRRQRPGHHPQLRQGGTEFFVAETAQLFTGEDQIALLGNACLHGHRSGGPAVVTGNHNGLNARAPDLGHGLPDTGPQGVPDGQQAYQR